MSQCIAIGPQEEKVELSALWTQLCSQKVRNICSFFTEQDCGAVLELAAGGRAFRNTIRARDLRILERLLFGDDQKTVAIESGLSTSSISAAVTRALSALGFECSGSKLPVLLVLAANAVRRERAKLFARTSLLEVQGRTCRVVLVPRPDRDFSGQLSKAEASVTRLLVEGLSHAEIAAQRGTSTRTVANQLAASFAKLRVSGRLQLLSQLVQRAARASELQSDRTPPILDTVQPTHILLQSVGFLSSSIGIFPEAPSSSLPRAVTSSAQPSLGS